jgi:hypothetical protein
LANTSAKAIDNSTGYRVLSLQQFSPTWFSEKQLLNISQTAFIRCIAKLMTDEMFETN